MWKRNPCNAWKRVKQSGKKCESKKKHLLKCSLQYTTVIGQVGKAYVYERNNNNNSNSDTSSDFAYISAFLALWRADCWCERTDQNDHLIIISAVNEYNIWFHITLLTLLLFARENFSSHHFIHHFNWKRNFFVCFISPSSSSFYTTAYSFCNLVSLLYLIYMCQHVRKLSELLCWWCIVCWVNFVFAK